MSAQQAQQAPNFTLEHIAGRQVSLSDYRGRPVVVTFSGRGSSEQVKTIWQTIRSRYTADQLPILRVADLRGVPKLVQGLAKRDIRKGFEDEAQKEADGLRAMGKSVPADLSQLVVLLTDWQGKVAPSFGLNDVEKQAVAVLVDGDGYIRGYGTGEQGGAQILALFG